MASNGSERLGSSEKGSYDATTGTLHTYVQHLCSSSFMPGVAASRQRLPTLQAKGRDNTLLSCLGRYDATVSSTADCTSKHVTVKSMAATSLRRTYVRWTDNKRKIPRDSVVTFCIWLCRGSAFCPCTPSRRLFQHSVPSCLTHATVPEESASSTSSWRSPSTSAIATWMQGCRDARPRTRSTLIQCLALLTGAENISLHDGFPRDQSLIHAASRQTR